MPPSRVIAAFTLAAAFVIGCKPATTDPTETKLGDTSVRSVEEPVIDDANLITGKCGRPRTDAVLAIYNKLNNGPVRRMVYTGKLGNQPVTFDFTPSHPIVRGMNAHGGFPKGVPLTLPPNSVWRFDQARMAKEVMLTSARLQLYLPCASDALSTQY